jgi:hypothetical protein
MPFYDVLFEHKYKILAVIVVIMLILGYIYYKNYLFCEEPVPHPEVRKKPRRKLERASSIEDSPSNSDKDFMLDDLEVEQVISKLQKAESKLVNKHNLTNSEIENINTKLNGV